MEDNNANKPFILLMGEMKEEVSGVINKYMPVIPSDIIADYLTILINSLRQNGQTQLAEAIQLYQQSQEVENDNTTEVSTQDELRDTEINE